MRKVTDPEVLGVLQSMRFEGNVAFLTSGNLDGKLYKKVDAVLKALEGKWNRGKGGHVFPGDAKTILDTILNDGEFHDLKKDDNLFETPTSLVERLVELTNPQKGQLVLEPSAGRGAIVRAFVGAGAVVTAVEQNPRHEPNLVEAGASVVRIADFLTTPLDPVYDIVSMNPPFAKQADMIHVTRAFELLVLGGILVAIMSPAFTFRTTKIAKAFKALVDENGDYEENPKDSFKQAGTAVNTVTVTLQK